MFHPRSARAHCSCGQDGLGVGSVRCKMSSSSMAQMGARQCVPSPLSHRSVLLTAWS